MDIKWLEDFVSLAQTRSFSRAAQLRQVTQPAFSRRIQALEAWAGAASVDRGGYPTRLTAAGQTMYAQALEMLQTLQGTRSMLRAHANTDKDTIGFAVPHTLAFTFFPRWVSQVQAHFGPFKSRLIALNVHDAVMRLVEGGCDVLIVYHHSSQPLEINTQRYDMVDLGRELLAPYSKPDNLGQPLFPLPGSSERPLPFLAYGPGAYLGRLTDLILKQAQQPIHLERIYETDMAEGLKAMALEGHGLAFLPYSAVRDELAQGRLVSADPSPNAPAPAPALTPHTPLPRFSLPMSLLAYREKPNAQQRAEPPKTTAQALWQFLQESHRLPPP